MGHWNSLKQPAPLSSATAYVPFPQFSCLQDECVHIANSTLPPRLPGPWNCMPSNLWESAVPSKLRPFLFFPWALSLLLSSSSTRGTKQRGEKGTSLLCLIKVCVVSQGCYNILPQTESFKQLKFMLSQFCRWKVHNPGVDRAVLPLASLGKNPFSPLLPLMPQGFLDLRLSDSNLCLSLSSCLLWALLCVPPVKTLAVRKSWRISSQAS